MAVPFSQAPVLFDDSTGTPLEHRRRWYEQQKDALPALGRLADGLAARRSGVTNVELVSRALVPIVTLTVGGRDVDISADNFNNVSNGSLLEACFSVRRKDRAFLCYVKRSTSPPG